MQISYEVGDRLIVDGELLDVVEKSRNRWGGDAYRVVPHLVPAPAGKRWLTPRILGNRSRVIDRRALDELVRAFYTRVRADEDLGPIFGRRLDGRWDPHLDTMVSFWSSVLLGEGSFAGAPMPKHRALIEAEPRHFGRWLELFRETLREIFAEPAAQIVEARALAIARGLSSGMFGRPFDDGAQASPPR